jgi:hypothetical protein
MRDKMRTSAFLVTSVLLITSAASALAAGSEADFKAAYAAAEAANKEAGSFYFPGDKRERSLESTRDTLSLEYDSEKHALRPRPDGWNRFSSGQTRRVCPEIMLRQRDGILIRFDPVGSESERRGDIA